jgi:hypothetical protein
MFIFAVNIVLIFWNPRVVSFRGDPITALDVAGLVLGILFVIIFVVSSIKDAIELDRLDRAKWKDQ